MKKKLERETEKMVTRGMTHETNHLISQLCWEDRIELFWEKASCALSHEKVQILEG